MVMDEICEDSSLLPIPLRNRTRKREKGRENKGEIGIGGISRENEVS